MGDSEFAGKDDLQSVRDVVYEHAQKLDELSQKIDDSPPVQQKFSQIDNDLTIIKAKVGS